MIGEEIRAGADLPRHNDSARKRDFDELWLGYLFQRFLADIHLVLRLRERRRPSDG